MGETSAVENIFAHVSGELSESIQSYATNNVLLSSRYLVVRRQKGILLGFCTHCRKERVYGQAQKHNARVLCTSCLSMCTVKHSGRGRKHLVDDGYFVYFSKSEKDPNTITAKGIYVQRDYSDDYTNVETKYVVTAIYVFGNGESQMMNRSYWWPNDNWYVRSKVFSESNSSMATKNCYLSIDSIAEAVKDTPFQYSTWEQHTNQVEMLEFFDVAAKYPCIEYLTKIGLPEVVRTKVNGGRTYGAINWRGKTLDKVLKVTKQELKTIRDADFPITLFTLRLFQMSKKDGSKLSLRDSYLMGNLIGGQRSFEELQKLVKYAKLNEIRNFVEKQFLRKNNNRYEDGGQVLITWRDYLADCRHLEMDVKEEEILFPSDLHRAHQNTIKKVKAKADEALNEKIRLRKNTLKKYEFESSNFFIRAAKDSEELIREGNVLKHCVGTYANRYANGQTDILVIRKKEEPDVPHFTVEIQDGRIFQVRGLKNCSPTPEIKNFIETFKSMKLKKPKRKKIAS